jgi:hypothetical protein
MSIAKGPSGTGLKTPNAKPAAPPVAVTPTDEWFEPEGTQVDARIEDRSDWARPADTHAVNQIEKMMEECLVDVPVSPIEDHRVAAGVASRPAEEERPAGGGEPVGRSRLPAVAIVFAGVAAVLAAAWFLVTS